MAFVVQQILDWRTRMGKVEYYVKWKGYAHSENTWEPENSLDCKDLIQQFKLSRQAKGQAAPSMEVLPDSSTKDPSGGQAKCIKMVDEEPSGSSGFDRGLEAKRILGASQVSGRTFLLIEFNGSKKAEMVLSTVAHKKIPQMVINFYEDRLVWTSSEGED